MEILYRIAQTPQEFEDGKALFQEYTHSLHLDLSFQDFASELKTINQQYNKPSGALLLAYKENIAVGCAGIRTINADTAELKRMYVRSEYRGHHIGRQLLERSIEIAGKLRYTKIRLDTLPEMTVAQNLYSGLGFYEIPAYRFSPVEGTVYMEKRLI
jgi:putative acetyltransferase